MEPTNHNQTTIYLAGGCFWGTQKFLSLIQGVTATEVGYANGNTEHPTYEQVCTQDTGHAEAVKVVYNPEVIPLSELLPAFFKTIDPTAKNRQGMDFGSQYRTGVYYTDPADREVIDKAIQALSAEYSSPIMTEVEQLQNYYPAEDYHQDYLTNNPSGYCHIPRSLFEYARNFKNKG